MSAHSLIACLFLRSVLLFLSLVYTTSMELLQRFLSTRLIRPISSRAYCEYYSLRLWLPLPIFVWRRPPKFKPFDAKTMDWYADYETFVIILCLGIILQITGQQCHSSSSSRLWHRVANETSSLVASLSRKRKHKPHRKGSCRCGKRYLGDLQSKTRVRSNGM